MECGRNIVAGDDVRWCGALHPSVPGDPAHREHRWVFSLCLSRPPCGQHSQNIVLVSILLFLSLVLYILYENIEICFKIADYNVTVASLISYGI